MYKKVVSAHQPNFLPYLGFFDKMRHSDIFVIRDEVLYVPKEFHNRNRIRINSNDNINAPASKWISAPVTDPKDFIKHALIKRDCEQKGVPWNRQVCHDIEVNYRKAPHYGRFAPELLALFDNSHDRMITLNMRLIKQLTKAFNIKTEILMASELGLRPEHYSESDGSEDLANMCKAVGADVYLSGQGGKNYLNHSHFDKIGVTVEYQEYEHPAYPQCFPGFLPYMSAIDALLCVGTMPDVENEK